MVEIAWANEVWHLGSTIGTDATLGVLTDVRKRFWKSVSAMTKSKAVWWSRVITGETKGSLLKSWILPMFLYGCESWGMTPVVKDAVRKKWNGILRMAVGMRSRAIHKLSGRTLVGMQDELKCTPILFYLNKRAVVFAFHTARRSDGIPPWQMMFGCVVASGAISGKCVNKGAAEAAALVCYVARSEQRA